MTITEIVLTAVIIMLFVEHRLEIRRLYGGAAKTELEKHRCKKQGAAWPAHKRTLDRWRGRGGDMK